MARCLLYYGTSEGHTTKIAGVMAERLRRRGIEVEVVRGPEAVDVEAFDAVLVGGSIHLGRHARHLRRFARRNHVVLQKLPSGFFTVCLAAASTDPGERTAARAISDAFLASVGWRPGHVAVFAGALRYSVYGPLTRWMMRRIAKAEGGDTDPSRDYEYTNWADVDAFVDRFADEVLAERHPVRAAEDSGVVATSEPL